MRLIENLKLKTTLPADKVENSLKGFTLIELLVSIFIFSLITVAILAIFVSTSGASQKAKAIKTLKESTEIALNSIAKDVRMGKIDPTYATGTHQSKIIITRNKGGNVCYQIGANYVGIDDSNGDCTGTIKNIIDLSGSGMSIDMNTSGFYSCPSTFGTAKPCPSGAASENRRGWIEINLNINMQAGQEMATDQINIQTTVSSRDYGWQDVN